MPVGWLLNKKWPSWGGEKTRNYEEDVSLGKKIDTLKSNQTIFFSMCAWPKPRVPITEIAYDCPEKNKFYA